MFVTIHRLIHRLYSYLMYNFLNNFFIILIYNMSSYGGNMKMKSSKPKKNVGRKTPKGMHRMPDGSFMKGERHGGNKDRNFIQKMDLKEGALKKMLKIKDGDKKLGIMELIRALKADNGSMFKFRGEELKMSALMRKRMNTAITLMKLSKKK